MPRRQQSRHSQGTSQRGMALTIALIVLVVVSILGIVALRTALFQNRVSINSQLSTLAFQAAESGLSATRLLDDVATTSIDERATFFEEAYSNPNEPRRLCVTSTGGIVTATDKGYRDPSTQQITYTEACSALPNSPAGVTVVISRSPNSGGMLEGTDPESGGEMTVQIRSEGEVTNTNVRAISAEDWYRAGPGGDGMTGFM